MSESFPVTLVEAMACGRTVIVTDIPGPRDIVQHGLNGMLFRAADVDTLTALLNKTLKDENLRRDLGASARRTVETSLTFERIVKIYEAALVGVVGDG